MASKPRSLLRIPTVSNTAPNGKASIVQRVATYGGKFRGGKRFSDNPSGKDPKLAGAMCAKYDFDSRGPKKTLAKAVEQSPVQYRSVFKSGTSRFKSTRTLNDLIYDTNKGKGAQMTDAVLATGRNYSSMRSRVQRFRPTSAPEMAHLGPGYIVADKVSRRPQSTVIGNSSRFAPDRGHSSGAVYDTDAGLKATVATVVAKSPRTYSVMKSSRERFKAADQDPQLRDAMERLHYEVDQGNKKTLATAVKSSPATYAHVFEAKYPRFLPPGYGRDRSIAEALQTIHYDVDQGLKSTLNTKMLESPVVYSKMKSKSPRFRMDNDSLSNTPAELGPGAHDTSAADAYLARRTPSIVHPSTQRFGSSVDSSKNLGSTYRPEWDVKSWGSKGFATPCTERPPLAAPSAVDQYYDIDHAHKMSVATAVAKSDRKYATTLKSKADRGVSHVVMLQGDVRVSKAPKGEDNPGMGPGKYDPRTTKSGHPHAIEVRDPHRGNSRLVSTARRFNTGHPDKTLSKAMQTLDYHVERFGTIKHSVDTTERRFSGIAKGCGRKDLNDP